MSKPLRYPLSFLSAMVEIRRHPGKIGNWHTQKCQWFNLNGFWSAGGVFVCVWRQTVIWFSMFAVVLCIWMIVIGRFFFFLFFQFLRNLKPIRCDDDDE